MLLLAADDWRYLAYHLGGPVVDTVVRGGQVVARVPGIIAAWPPGSRSARRAKEFRHEYVWEDDEGNELDPEDAQARKSEPGQRRATGTQRAASPRRPPGGAR